MTSGSQNVVQLEERWTMTRLVNCLRFMDKFLMLRALRCLRFLPLNLSCSQLILLNDISLHHLKCSVRNLTNVNFAWTWQNWCQSVYAILKGLLKPSITKFQKHIFWQILNYLNAEFRELGQLIDGEQLKYETGSHSRAV